MKRSEIEVGQTYVAKVSGRLVPVRILRDLGMLGRDDRSHGWIAVNQLTQREVHIRTAARLRRKA